ncbi:MAG: hypothetical protein P8Y64_03275 [Gammaproteobacteria bacterium]|jgi:purine-binding chemotaxis protein CheW
MKRSESAPGVLKPQEQALDGYLDDLLLDEGGSAAAAPSGDADAGTAAASPGVPETQSAAAPPRAQDWLSEQSAQALNHYHYQMIRAGTLRLAVQHRRVTRILSTAAGFAFSSRPGFPPWYLGQLKLEPNGVDCLERSIGVIDAARLILPDDLLGLCRAPDAAPAHVLVMDGCSWGLACDEIDEILSLPEEAVHWRTQRTARQWLAGTSLQHRCAILDLQHLAALVDNLIGVGTYGAYPVWVGNAARRKIDVEAVLGRSE